MMSRPLSHDGHEHSAMLLPGIELTSGGKMLYWIKLVVIIGKYSGHNKTNTTKRQVRAQKNAVHLKQYRNT